MLCTRPRYQVSVYRTIGPLVSVLIDIDCAVNVRPLYIGHCRNRISDVTMRIKLTHSKI